jgi:hypothetical protein
MTLGMCFISTFIFGVFDATLSADLDKLHISQFNIGLEFLVTFLVYLVASLILGSKCGIINKRMAMTAGCLINGFFLIFIGPS